VPWIGTHVFVTKIGNPLKGYVGVVKDVLCGQDTASGLRVVVQLAHYAPSSPFKKTILDYEDVVEQKSVNESSPIRVNTYYAYFKNWIFTF
jgi:hypothetical protein